MSTVIATPCVYSWKHLSNRVVATGSVGQIGGPVIMSDLFGLRARFGMQGDTTPVGKAGRHWKRGSRIDRQEILQEEGAGISDRPPGSHQQSSEARENIHAPSI